MTRCQPVTVRSRRLAAATVCLLASLATSLAAQQRAPQPDLSRLDAYFEMARSAWEVPGLAVAVLHRGKAVLAKGYGVRERGKTEAAGPDTLFAIASNTKAFTAATVAILVEEGKLKWDTRVADLLPGFQIFDPYVTAELRVDDLFCHRAGFRTFSGDLLWLGTPYDRKEILRRARYLRPWGRFRASYGYSNLMYLAAGEIVATLAGKSWEEFVRERLIEPLGMKRTVLSVKDVAARGDVAMPHGVYGNGNEPIEWSNWDIMAPAGGIISSVNDMSRWLLLQLGGGTLDGRKYFSEESQRRMWILHNPLSLTEEARKRNPHTHFTGYGLGWALSDYRGRLTCQHGGAYEGMASRVALMPEEGLGIVVLTNSNNNVAPALVNRTFDEFLGAPERDWSGEYLERFRKSAAESRQRVQAMEKPPAGPVRPAAPLNAYAGRYGGPLYGDATVSVENGRLVLRLLPNPQLAADLEHRDADVFLLRWRRKFNMFGAGSVQFLTDGSGKVTEFRLDVPNEDFWFDELEFKRLE